MRVETTLSRALGNVTVGAHRRFRAHEREKMYYRMAERVHQFQQPVGGTVGLVPVEGTVKIAFDVLLMYEYGYLRDSQLLEPQTHFGFTGVSAPVGTILYAHVKEWNQDADFNYVGATVTVGAHNPIIAATGASSVTSVKFSATMHSSFQGFGVPIDPDTGEN